MVFLYIWVRALLLEFVTFSLDVPLLIILHSSIPFPLFHYRTCWGILLIPRYWAYLTSLKSQTWDVQLKIPTGGLVLRIFTFWKNPSTSAGFECAYVGSWAEHVTPIPPRPTLCIHRTIILNIFGDIKEKENKSTCRPSARSQGTNSWQLEV